MDCPSRQQIGEYLQGQLPGDQSNAITGHLDACPNCERVADELDGPSQSTLMGWLHRAVGKPIGFPEVSPGAKPKQPDFLIEALSRAKRVAREDTRLVAADETGIDRNEDDQVQISLESLAPPQDDDELARLGEFRILEVIGIGGMGVVFRAEDSQLGREVALKLIHPVVLANRSAKDRLLREARATAAVDHPNIVHIYQVGEDRGVPFIAMQLLRGESLHARLARDRQLDKREVIRIGREITAGLAAAHRKELIHRDIKPRNIWLDGASGQVKILDFGLVRMPTEGQDLTHSDVLLGTPRYMAPEQALGRPVDSRCDLFSLGSLLYHLITGQDPFGGGNVTATLVAVAHEEPQPVQQLCPAIHPALARLIGRLLAKDPNDRPQTAADAERELQEVGLLLDQGSNGTDLHATGEFSAETEEVGGDHGPNSEEEPSTRRRGGWSDSFPRRVVIGAAAALLLLAGGAWLLGVLLKIETDRGTLLVKVSGEDFVAFVQGETVTIKNVETGDITEIRLDEQQIRRPGLPAGEYQFLIETNSGLRTRTRQFTIRGDEDAEVEVWWEDSAHTSASGSVAGDPAPPLWDGWPQDAPMPAVAPFDEQQAVQHQQAWAQHVDMPIKIQSATGIMLRLIPPGEFLMGSTESEIDLAISGNVNERPRHRVCISKPFYCSVHQVTQQQYQQVTSTNPSRIVGRGSDRHPVDSCRWENAVRFCNALSKVDGLDPYYNEDFTIRGGTGYRLPTEAEWEHACRAGTQSAYSFGDDPGELRKHGWAGTADATHPVGLLLANSFGLYDMHGNVWEWCQDWYGDHTYRNRAEQGTQPVVNPTGPQVGRYKTQRGGSWSDHPHRARSAERALLAKTGASEDDGFRVVRSAR